MLVRKTKNFLPLLIIGIILVVIGIIYYAVIKNLGVLLLLVIFGAFFIALALFFMIKRKLESQRLKLKKESKEYITGHIAEIKKVDVALSKLLKDTPYEIIVECEIEGVMSMLTSNWVDKDYLEKYSLTRGKNIKICYLNKNNYYLFFKEEKADS